MEVCTFMESNSYIIYIYIYHTAAIRYQIVMMHKDKTAAVTKNHSLIKITDIVTLILNFLHIET